MTPLTEGTKARSMKEIQVLQLPKHVSRIIRELQMLRVMPTDQLDVVSLPSSSKKKFRIAVTSAIDFALSIVRTIHPPHRRL